MERKAKAWRGRNGVAAIGPTRHGLVRRARRGGARDGAARSRRLGEAWMGQEWRGMARQACMGTAGYERRGEDRQARTGCVWPVVDGHRRNG